MKRLLQVWSGPALLFVAGWAGLTLVEMALGAALTNALLSAVAVVVLLAWWVLKMCE